MSSSLQSIRLEVYVQSLAPIKNPHVGTLLERINRLNATDAIESADVYVVGKELCTETALITDAGQDLCARILQFRDWARRNDKELGSFFQPQSVKSALTDDEYETISLPTFTLAEFADETLRFVTPCNDGETHYTPQDRLDLLAGEALSEPKRQPLKS